MTKHSEKVCAQVSVRVTPKASRDAVRVEPDGHLRIALTSPPVDGKANAALVAFLAKALHLPKRDVNIVRGGTSREKIVAISGMPIDDVLSLLSEKQASS